MAPADPGSPELIPEHLSVPLEWFLLGLGAAIALFFAHRGFHSYTSGTERDERLAQLGGAWNIDKTYMERIVQPIKLFAFLVASLVDQFVIDGAVNGAGWLARTCGSRLRAVVDGSVKTYALWMGAGAAGLVIVWIWSVGA